MNILPITTQRKPIYFGWNKSSFEDKDFVIKNEQYAPSVIKIIKAKISDKDSQGDLYNSLGDTYENESNNTLAEAFYTEASEQYKDVFSLGLIDSLVNLQNILKKTNSDEKALEVGNRIKQLVRNRALPKRQIQSAESKKAATISKIKTYTTIAEELLNNGMSKDALVIYQGALADAKLSIAPNDIFLPHFLELGGDIYSANNLFDESNNNYEKAIGLINNDKNKVAAIENKIAKNLLCTGNQTLSMLELRKALNNSTTHKNIIDNLLIRAYIHSTNKDLTLFGNIINLVDMLSKTENSKQNATFSMYQALLAKLEGKLDESSQTCINALTQLKNNNKIYSPDFVVLSMMLADNNYSTYLESSDDSDLTRAINTYNNALKIANKINNPNLQFNVTIKLAKILCAQGKYRDAERYALNAQEINKKNANAFGVDKTLTLLADIYRNINPKEALGYLETLRENMILNARNDSDVNDVTKKLIEIAKATDDKAIVSKYTAMLSTNNPENMLIVAEQKIENKDYDSATNYCTNVQKSNSATEVQKALAKINLGFIYVQKENLREGVKNIEDACKELSTICKADNFSNKENVTVLVKGLSLLNYIYIQKYPTEMGKVAIIFEDIAKILNKKDILPKSEIQEAKNNPIENNQFLRMKINASTAAAYYKAEKYTKSEIYFVEYIKNILSDKEFNYMSLSNEDFTKNIINEYSQDKIHALSTALEMLGVANVKNNNFHSALLCFKTAFQLRRDTVGENYAVANDMNAIARIAMIGNESFSVEEIKSIMKKSIEIMKRHLGNDHPEVKKQEEFLKTFFGKSFTSAMKYLYVAYQNIKEEIGFTNKHKDEIIKDFHLKFQELYICE